MAGRRGGRHGGVPELPEVPPEVRAVFERVTAAPASLQPTLALLDRLHVPRVESQNLAMTLRPVPAAMVSFERLATILRGVPLIPCPDPDEAALFQLLLATWPGETPVTTLWDFLDAFAALRTAATTADLTTAARRVLAFPAFISPVFPRKAVRRVIAAHGRGPTARRWVVEDVLLPTLVDLMQGEVLRPQRVGFDRQWTKIVRGFFRPSRTAAAIPYRPGTIADVVPAEFSSVHFYRRIRQRTKKVAAEWIAGWRPDQTGPLPRWRCRGTDRPPPRSPSRLPQRLNASRTGSASTWPWRRSPRPGARGPPAGGDAASAHCRTPRAPLRGGGPYALVADPGHAPGHAGHHVTFPSELGPFTGRARQPAAAERPECCS